MTVIKLLRMPITLAVVMATVCPNTDWALTHDYDVAGVPTGTMSLTIHRELAPMVAGEIRYELAKAS